MNNINSYLRVQSKIKYFIFLCIYFCLFPFSKALYGRKNNWLICERGMDAQDNGYVFFKYLRAHHQEINCFYLIDKKSPDYNKVNSIGKVVQFGSFKHFFMVIGCGVKISSHLFGYSPWITLTLYYRRNKTHSKHVFLQHGIIKNYHPGLVSYNCRSLDLFVCGAKPEYEYILNEFNYNNSVPQYTGLPRYDLLKNDTLKKQIVIMPTWRSNLVNLSDEEFIQTEFYLQWQKIIKDSELKSIANDNKLKIKFYLHNSFQKFTRLFSSSNVVEIISYKDETVQSHLKESKLLITDYSSVFFDFAYLNKPVIYYQFDENDYYSNHYEKGYFDYRRDGFGDVCNDSNSLLASVNQVIKNKMTIESKYSNRVKNFFIYRDSNNCDRVFNSIQKVLNEK